jgi:hypothetical protein
MQPLYKEQEEITINSKRSAVLVIVFVIIFGLQWYFFGIHFPHYIWFLAFASVLSWAFLYAPRPIDSLRTAAIAQGAWLLGFFCILWAIMTVLLLASFLSGERDAQEAFIAIPGIIIHFVAMIVAGWMVVQARHIP